MLTHWCPTVKVNNHGNFTYTYQISEVLLFAFHTASMKKYSMKNKAMKNMVIGIAFYKREQWPLLLETAVDSLVLERTYDEWMEVLDVSVDKIREAGLEPELVEIDVNDLLAWCKKKKIKNDGKARSMFITELSKRKRGD